jgi:nucleoid DNA-binding protein
MTTTTVNKLIDKAVIAGRRGPYRSHSRFVLAMIRGYLERREGPVRVPKLGTFKVVRIKGHFYRHPKTGLMCEVGPSTTVRFKASEVLLKAIRFKDSV